MKSHLRAGLAAAVVCFAVTVLAADNTVSLFNGKDLSGWKPVGGRGANQWQVGRAALDPADPTKLTVAGPGDELISPQSGVNLVTDASFGDCTLEVEFMVSKKSNSGVKMMRIYEIQILDSYGKPTVGIQDSGAVYDETPPRVNASKKPGEWQTLLIDFRAPRFDAAGQKTANAKFVKVILNGQVVQENVEIAHGTNVARKAKEHPTGQIYLQGDHGPVAFRNLKITVPARRASGRTRSSRRVRSFASTPSPVGASLIDSLRRGADETKGAWKAGSMIHSARGQGMLN